MRFFFHYNRPASLQRGKPTISIHFQQKCHLVDEIKCYRETTSKIRKSSPKFVMEGNAADIQIVDDCAYIF